MIDRKALFKHLDKASKTETPSDDIDVEGADSDTADDYAAEKQLIAAIFAKDPEAVHEALKACGGSDEGSEDEE